MLLNSGALEWRQVHHYFRRILHWLRLCLLTHRVRAWFFYRVNRCFLHCILWGLETLTNSWAGCTYWEAVFCGNVHPQLIFSVESLLTVVAFIWSVNKWSAKSIFKSKVERRGFSNDKNRYLLFIQVSTHMILHVAFGSESLPTAHGASKRLFISVNSHVDFQIR